MHLNPFPIGNTPIEGEMTIDDLVLFSSTGVLARVERKWTAVKKYSLMMDRTHAQAIDAVKAELAKVSRTKIESEEALEDAVLAEMELEALSDSDSYLVKSLILLNLISFV